MSVISKIKLVFTKIVNFFLIVTGLSLLYRIVKAIYTMWKFRRAIADLAPTVGENFAKGRFGNMFEEKDINKDVVIDGTKEENEIRS